MKERKSNKLWYVIGIVALLIIVGVLGKYTNLLSFAGNSIPLPASVYSGLTSQSQLCNQCSGVWTSGTTAYSSISNATYVYTLTNTQAYGGCGTGCLNYQAGGGNAYIAINSSGVAYANAQNNAQIAGLASTIAQHKANQAADAKAGECTYIDSPCTAEVYYISALYNITAIDQAAIVYNNAIPVTTTISTTSTTTIAQCSGTSCNPPPNPLAQIWQAITSFFSNVYKFLTTPLSLSVAINPANFTVSQPFTVQVSIPIPAQWQTHNTTTSLSKFVQQTYCEPFVTSNTSTQLISPAPTPILITGNNYTTIFSYTPTGRQLLIAGGVCRSDNISYTALTGTWGSWSNPIIVANQSAIVKAGINQPPQNILAQIWASIVSFFTNLFKGL